MKNLSHSPQITTAGCSFGAYHALNFALKHPDLSSGCIALSGSFDMRQFMNGYYDNDFYFNNPVDYIPNMSDPWFLDRYRSMKIVLAAGDHDICLGDNFRMAEILGKKGIPHWLDVWTGGEKHDWPLWQRMAVKILSQGGGLTMRKIGIIYGMENSFPSALVDRINQKSVPGVSAEHIRIGGIKMAEPQRLPPRHH